MILVQNMKNSYVGFIIKMGQCTVDYVKNMANLEI